MLPTLYKMDSKGKIRQWTITCIETADGSFYTIEHGLVDGKQQSTDTLIEEGKNIGKANETTHWEQCLSEAESLWKKQRDRKGYTEAIPQDKPFRPMLAQSYDKHGKKIIYPCYLQNKLDGIRCLAVVKNNKVTFISRQGKEFKAIDHLKSQLKNVPNGTVLDGELYCHHEEFQEICSAVKRDKPSDSSKKVEYHLYDLISDDDYDGRLVALKKIHKGTGKAIKLVQTKQIADEDALKSEWRRATKEGYEGVMLRNKTGPYKINGRSYDLQKYKQFQDDEFEIVGAYENKGKMKGECTFICVTKNGTEFGVKPEGSSERRRQYWKDFQAGKLTGKMLTVRYFGLTTSEDPVPRFPIGVIIRDYE
jgi:DNA ligase-1